MIIDCHGHYTTAPEPHQKYREGQQAQLDNPSLPNPEYGVISDDQIVESIEQNQLRLQKERGADLTLFSPRASAMGHHIGGESTSVDWSRACNNLIKRVTDLYPENFAPVCQLPQSEGVNLDSSIAELERCINELGFVGCNLNPDPSGGHWTSKPLTDSFWYPMFEKMVELDVPAMIHVSASCNPNFHATGAHYINAIPPRLCNLYKVICLKTSRTFDLLFLMAVAQYLTLGAISWSGRHAKKTVVKRPRHEQRLF